MNKQAIQAEALSRAVGFQSFSNYPAIVQGFLDKGILASEIEPRKNVFTYNAWKALGRQVRKGEKGVRIVTFREVSRKTRNKQTGEEELSVSRWPWHTTVFHVSQTEPIERQVA